MILNFSNVFHMPCFPMILAIFREKTNLPKLFFDVLNPFVFKTNLHFISKLGKSGRKFSHVFDKLEILYI